MPKNLPYGIQQQMSRVNLALIASSVFVLLGWAVALLAVGADRDQGDVFRILFVHVPVAWCAFFWIFFAALAALVTLMKKKSQEKWDMRSRAAAELGAIFSILVLVTGSIWGRPTWGVWWDWDPRLTTSLIMVLMIMAYFLFRHFTPNRGVQRRISSVILILTAVNVPITYYSVNLWRSLHQPQTFVRSSQNASTDITSALFLNVATLFLFSIALFALRRQSLAAIAMYEENE